MKKLPLCILALAFLWLFAAPEQAQAQGCPPGSALGISWTWQDGNAVYGYSATFLDYNAGLCYDPAVYGRFSEGNFSTENARLLVDAYTEGYADWIPAEILFGYGAPRDFEYYNTDSIHYVLEYYQYYACFTYCGYYWYDPLGFGFTSGAGPNFSGGGGPSYWAVRRRRLGSTYHTIIYRAPDPCQLGQQFTSTGAPCPVATPTPTPVPTPTPSQSVSVTYQTETQNNGIPLAEGTALGGLPNRNSTNIVATGSPSGGTYSWSTSSDKVRLDNKTSPTVTVNALKKSDAVGDVIITLTYKISEELQRTEQIAMTVQQPTSMKYLSTTVDHAVAPHKKTRRDRTVAGWEKKIDWQVMDHLNQPMTFRMPIGDTLDNVPNFCNVSRKGEGTLLSRGLGTGFGGRWVHTYELFSPACLNGGNCAVVGFQRYTVNGFVLSNDDKTYRYQCNGIQVEGDGSTLTPWTPPARKKTAMFVDQIYSTAFNDWASDEELLTWTNRLNSAHAQGQAQLLAEARALARAVFDSAEYRNINRSDEDFITDLYNGYLGRQADQGGFDFWLATYRNDKAQGLNGHEHMLQAFEGSTEFANLVYSLEAEPPPTFCNPTDEQFCNNNGGLWDSSNCFCEYPPPPDPCYNNYYYYYCY